MVVKCGSVNRNIFAEPHFLWNRKLFHNVPMTQKSPLGRITLQWKDRRCVKWRIWFLTKIWGNGRNEIPITKRYKTT